MVCKHCIALEGLISCKWETFWKFEKGKYFIYIKKIIEYKHISFPTTKKENEVIISMTNLPKPHNPLDKLSHDKLFVAALIGLG